MIEETILKSLQFAVVAVAAVVAFGMTPQAIGLATIIYLHRLGAKDGRR